MEFCWFAICTISAFIPWISAEEKLLYQTPSGNHWGGWDVNSNGLSSLGVIKVVFCCFTQYPDYEHPICQRAAFLWWSGCIIVDSPSLLKGTFVRRAPLSMRCFLPVCPCYFTLLFCVLLSCMWWAPYCCCSLGRGWLLVTQYYSIFFIFIR